MKSQLLQWMAAGMFVLSSCTTFAQTDETYSEEKSQIQNSQKQLISIFPIPTAGIINIDFNEPAMTLPKVQVYDMIGNSVKGIQVERISPERFIINLAGHEPGFYFIKVQTEKIIYSKRITLVNAAALSKPKVIS
jgi:hypothetical protein